MDKGNDAETSDIHKYFASFYKEVECDDLEDADSTKENCQVSGDYQTITVVPPDSNPNELSYTVSVSEPGASMSNDAENVNVTLYDTNDTEDLNYVEQYSCSFCDYTNTKRYLLSRHMKTHSDVKPHKCDICERGFKTIVSLNNHINTHTGTRSHICEECDSSFTTSGELVRHIRYKHTHEKPHKCTECDYASVELSKLKRHMRVHTGEKPYKCPHCPYASPDTYKLKRHIRIHTGEKPYECDVCQSRFTQSNSLKAHKLIHSENRPVFHCKYCPATCGRKQDLRIHIEKLHSCDKPHRCNKCGKIFLDRYSYKIHNQSHFGEKCFKCDFCSYRSASQSHLESHMFVHTNTKPFQCDECDMSFRKNQLLKRHKNLYHNSNYVPPEPKEKPHVCFVCSKGFRHRGNLLKHFELHDPDTTVMGEEDNLQLVKTEILSEEDQDGDEDIQYMQDPENPDQQVVLFEVIQLPSSDSAHSEDQTGTLLDQTVSVMDVSTLLLKDGDGQEYAIIEKADDSMNNFLTFDGSV